VWRDGQLDVGNKAISSRKKGFWGNSPYWGEEHRQLHCTGGLAKCSACVLWGEKKAPVDGQETAGLKELSIKGEKGKQGIGGKVNKGCHSPKKKRGAPKNWTLITNNPEEKRKRRPGNNPSSFFLGEDLPLVAGVVSVEKKTPNGGAEKQGKKAAAGKKIPNGKARGGGRGPHRGGGMGGKSLAEKKNP